MKIELAQGYIEPTLTEELGLHAFTALFDSNLPIIQYQLLRPLEKAAGEEHFANLCSLKKSITDSTSNLEQLLVASAKLPALEQALSFFERGQLEQYHLFELGNFLIANGKLLKLEKDFPLTNNPTCLDKLNKILNEYTIEEFSSLRLTREEQKLQKQINTLDKTIAQQLTKLETEIKRQTGLEMTYPFPREIDPNSANRSKLKSCSLLTCSTKQGMLLVDYLLPDELQETSASKEALQNKFSNLIREKLSTINQKLSPCYQEFSSYYRQRQKRCFSYHLLRTAEKYNLVLPELTQTLSLTLKKAKLPALEKLQPNYQPLDVELNQGAAVLFGANLTGKTTTLKTIYFILTLIRLGLPVPAQSAVLTFPEELDLLLKSSGSIEEGQSSFSGELDFLVKAEKSGQYILVDELLHSTSPVSGADLSGIFLSAFSSAEKIFFCTSQYPEVFTTEGISFYRMLDNLETSQEMPYQLEKVENLNPGQLIKENLKPLRIALGYPFSKPVKDTIQQMIQKGEEDAST